MTKCTMKIVIYHGGFFMFMIKQAVALAVDEMITIVIQIMTCTNPPHPIWTRDGFQWFNSSFVEIMNHHFWNDLSRHLITVIYQKNMHCSILCVFYGCYLNSFYLISFLIISNDCKEFLQYFQSNHDKVPYFLLAEPQIPTTQHCNHTQQLLFSESSN